jgi:hypothetical protein
MDGPDNVAIFRNLRPQHTKVTGKSDGRSSDRAGLNDKKECPAVEKSPERGVGFTQVDVLASSVRHHRR